MGKRLFLRPEEVNRVIVAAGQRGRQRFRDRVLVRFVYRHGLRASEAIRTRWDQFDLEAGLLHVERAKSGNPCTHSLDRDELRDLRKQALGPYVFESERGGHVSHDTLARIVEEAGRVAALDVHVHPHMLRHAAGYCLINGGTDMRLVQDFLGHKHINTTVLYTSLAPGRLKDVRVR
jgi:site-specific recombinase XerD